MDESPPERDIDTTALVVSLALVLAGVGVLGGLAYADRTTTLSADYAAVSENCGSLDGATNLVEDGIGLRAETLNESAVRACANTTFAEYRRARTRSMQTAPINPFQWLWFGGPALLSIAAGGALLWRQLRE